jgi:hypothetical protein
MDLGSRPEMHPEVYGDVQALVARYPYPSIIARDKTRSRCWPSSTRRATRPSGRAEPDLALPRTPTTGRAPPATLARIRSRQATGTTGYGASARCTAGQGAPFADAPYLLIFLRPQSRTFPFENAASRRIIPTRV